MDKKGFTLIEMLTTTIILVLVFALLAIIFARATNIHKIVRSGGDAENFGIYIVNTIVYGPGINREKGLAGVNPFLLSASTTADTLTFQGQDGQYVHYFLDGTSVRFYTSPDGVTLSPPLGIDLRPTWAADRQLEVLPESEFIYYRADGTQETTIGNPVYAVEIKLILKTTLQNPQEAITLFQRVRIRNKIDF